MKINLFVFIILLLQPFFVSSAEFSPGNPWLDSNGNEINAHAGSILYDKGVYYWFGEKRTTSINNEGKVELYKSRDLYTWNYVRTVLDLSMLPGKYSIERPKVLFNKETNTYVMWFHIELGGKYNTGVAGVAVSDRVDGDYKFINQMRSNKGKKAYNSFYGTGRSDFIKSANEIYGNDVSSGQMFRDFTLFKDTDDKAYVIYESENNYSLQVAELDKNYTNFTGKYTRILIGDKNEAPIVVKHKNKYFLITSGLNGFNPTIARLAESDNIFGPWVNINGPVMTDNESERATTFHSQGAFMFNIADEDGSKMSIFVADRWNKKNLEDSTYIWLPVNWGSGVPQIKWYDHWRY